MLLTALVCVFLSSGSSIITSESLASLSAGSESGLTAVDYFDPAEYMLNPGDDIWLSFPGGVPFSGMNSAVSVVSIPIGLDGVLNIPAMPGIDTYGMNLQELQSTVSTMFSRYYRGMRVSSGLARSASFQIPVTGQVSLPGIVTVSGLTRLSTALELAGGVTGTGAVSRILVISQSEDSTAYNLNDFTVEGDLGSNPLVHRNTRIHVEAARAVVTLEGALSTKLATGAINRRRLVTEYIAGESACEILTRFGGVAGAADLEGCFVYRVCEDSASVRIPFSMQGTSSPVLLQPGDRIVVPASPAFINVTGEVVLTAPVPYSPGMPVSYYIGMAGGFNSVARRNSVRVQLADGERRNADLADVVLPGSTIEVPRVPVKFWEEYLTILTGVATVVIAYQSIFSN
jgi:protein involved in polysaccharide export with SLBB domain